MKGLSNVTSIPISPIPFLVNSHFANSRFILSSFLVNSHFANSRFILSSFLVNSHFASSSIRQTLTVNWSGSAGRKGRRAGQKQYVPRIFLSENVVLRITRFYDKVTVFCFCVLL